MVEETAVLQQPLIVGMSEEANLRVRENQTAKEIVLPIVFHYATEWFFNQTAPGLAVYIVCVEATPEIFFRHERLQHCVPDIFGKDTNQGVKFLELLRPRTTSRKHADGLP